MKIKIIILASIIGAISVPFGSSIASQGSIIIDESEYSYLSITNLSLSSITINVFDEIFDINPTEGVSIFCVDEGYIQVSITTKTERNLELPCNSKLEIN